jgi:hypothetical protein
MTLVQALDTTRALNASARPPARGHMLLLDRPQGQLQHRRSRDRSGRCCSKDPCAMFVVKS